MNLLEGNSRFSFSSQLLSCRSHWDEGGSSFKGPEERSNRMRAEASVGRKSEPTDQENPGMVGTFSLDPRALGIRVGRRGAERAISIFLIERETQALS